MTEPLEEDKRQDIFRTLVESQDEGFAAEDSRTRVAAQFNIDVTEIVSIEREGIAKQWPPL